MLARFFANGLFKKKAHPPMMGGNERIRRLPRGGKNRRYEGADAYIV